MITLPTSSVLLTEDELDYAFGGATAAGVFCSLTGLSFTIISAFDVVAIKKQLRKQTPDKDNILLTLDAYNSYMSTPYGAYLMIASTTLTVLGFIL